MPRSRPTDAERWERARVLLEQAGGTEARELARRRRRIWLGLLVGLMGLVVAAVAVGVSVAVLARPHRHHTSPHVPVWSFTIGGVVSLAALALGTYGVVVFVRLNRAGSIGWRWSVPTSALSLRQRRDVMKQIRGKATVEPDTLPITRDLASRLRAQMRPLALLVASAVLCDVASAFFTQRRPELIVAVVLVLYLAVLSPLLARDFCRAGRFLQAHPVPPRP